MLLFSCIIRLKELKITGISRLTIIKLCTYNIPGAMVQTLIPDLFKSLAIGRVIPTMAPLLAE